MGADAAVGPAQLHQVRGVGVVGAGREEPVAAQVRRLSAVCGELLGVQLASCDVSGVTSRDHDAVAAQPVVAFPAGVIVGEGVELSWTGLWNSAGRVFAQGRSWRTSASAAHCSQRDGGQPRPVVSRE
ncbi:hypothetical protein RB628_31145 [Streptomyces sp. ADMS]|nr:hypothetical protein [Streptomyces sp. ADMS]MDW4909678.1 hypothetical protein [Streptomyces sp. ADMS]